MLHRSMKNIIYNDNLPSQVLKQSAFNKRKFESEGQVDNGILLSINETIIIKTIIRGHIWGVHDVMTR